MLCKILALLLTVVLLAPAAGAGLVLSGGGLALVEEGPVAAAAGSPAPVNLATGANAFTSGDLGPELGIPFHRAVNLNDGLYGNVFSWVASETFGPDGPYAGISLGAVPVTLQSIAFGRSNVLSGDPCGGGVCADRYLGTYQLQFTQVPNPDPGTPGADWTQIGTLDYGPSDGSVMSYNNPWQRHRYNFDPVTATGIRLIVPVAGLHGGTAIDEIELYDVPGDVVEPPSPLDIQPAAGFAISWDGNDGDFFDAGAPPAGAIVPDNAALAAKGVTAFSSSDLGSELGIPYHLASNANDGFYGNVNSWLGGSANPFDPIHFVGVSLGTSVPVARVAWGRDNGNNVTDCCGGQLQDRWEGTYVLQYTTVTNPDADTAETADASTGWQTIGSFDYKFEDQTFTPYLRHEFDISLAGGRPILATGLRLLVPATGMGGGTAIDEFEVYAIPEPATMTLLCLLALSLPKRLLPAFS